MPFANLEIISMFEHVFHGKGIFTGQLFEVVSQIVHPAQADPFSEFDHSFR